MKNLNGGMPKMEQKQRCTNCGKFPFCYEIQDASAENNCEKWIKRKGDVSNGK